MDRSEAEPYLRIASSQGGKAANLLSVRFWPFVLAGLASVAGLAFALGARRAHRALPTSVPAVSAETSDPIAEARARLEQFESAERRSTDFAHLPPANLTHGADPFTLQRLDAQHSVGVLRGASALVVLDARLQELQRIPLESSAVAVTVDAAGDCWAAGERSPVVSRFHFDGRTLKRVAELSLPGILGIRALAVGPSGGLSVLDVRDGRLLTIDPRRSSAPILDSRFVGHGPIALQRMGSFLIVDVLLDHALIVYRLNPLGVPVEERARIHHDGPIWGFDARLLDDQALLLLATGVEDHPLDRSDGSFGYIDSFAYAYLLPRRGAPRELWRTNVSALGVVTPKAPLLTITGDGAEAFVAGYGSDRACRLRFGAQAELPPEAHCEPFYPGTSAVIRLDSGALGFADPLLDAWLWVPKAGAIGNSKGELRSVEAEQAPRASLEERLGEALFFTTLMAPANSSDGSHSRFSCETCHFEGYVDGRVHYTGRGDVHVSTKPLRGLFNNRPHFSRALDADLATVSHHEFRVAGKGNGKDPWFELRTEEFPWLEALGVRERTLGPEALRRALIAFLMRFTHTTNPAVVGRDQFDARERSGAELFRDRCARCHAPRLESDVAESAASFESWQRAIFSREGPLVWASATYHMTGVTPYVAEGGTRVPSLRRAYAKWPYFTNGSADTLLAVVERARFDDARFFHDNAPPDPLLRAFDTEQALALARFLELL